MYTYSLFYNLLKNRKLSISRLEASLTIKEGGGGKDCEKKRANEDCLERVFGRGSISDRRFITTSRTMDDDRFEPERGYNRWRCAN